MQYQVLTIFPELFEQFRQSGLVGRGVEKNLLDIKAHSLRDFAINSYGQVDDTPYGGGSGMVLRPEPAVAAISSAKERDPRAKVVLFTPRGKVFNREIARDLVDVCQKDQGGLILLCCRYEGVDERIAENWVDYEISLGDYVMMGGEVAAMALIETTSRLLPGVLGNPNSISDESFESGFLEYPQYTKPQDFQGLEVPEVLLSGHHAQIEAWRRDRSQSDTKVRRPDLIVGAESRDLVTVVNDSVENDSREGDTLVSQGLPSCEIDVALIHFPVHNKEGKTITSSITNLDLHDIARSVKTYGLGRYYIVHPTKALRRLMGKICQHWEEGYGLHYNPNRGEALEKVSLVPDFDDVLIDIESRTGSLPKIISTSARQGKDTVSFPHLRSVLHQASEPHLMLLGTGWGLANEILERADYQLEPVCGFTEYNHLSVRAAAAIMFDRLLGKHSA